jgi:hypothetical protein
MEQQMSGSGSVEDSILGSIPDIHDDVDTGTDTSQGGGDTGGDATTSSAPTQQGGGQTSAQPGQPQAQVRRRHDGLVEVPNAEQPNTRDLVDPITGRVVAKGGIERRVYEEGQRHSRENNQLKNQLSQATRQLASINEVTQEAVRLNVSPQDQVVAIRIMAEFMRDPVKTLEALVSEVKSKGYPIPFLEQGVTPGMDMAAIQRMIDNKMAPITQQQVQSRQQQEHQQRAEAEINAFLEDNQEANSNLDVLSEMLQAQPGLSLHSAYTKMIRWAHENQLDWTQSLKQQIAQQRQQPTPQQQTQQPAPTRPIPGRGVQPTQATPVGNGAVTQYNENASWADIIRQSMQEHGVNLN